MAATYIQIKNNLGFGLKYLKNHLPGLIIAVDYLRQPIEPTNVIYNNLKRLGELEIVVSAEPGIGQALEAIIRDANGAAKKTSSREVTEATYSFRLGKEINPVKKDKLDALAQRYGLEFEYTPVKDHYWFMGSTGSIDYTDMSVTGDIENVVRLKKDLDGKKHFWQWATKKLLSFGAAELETLDQMVP